MNKQAYRVIFNKKRGMLMAVAENISVQGKCAGVGSGSSCISSPLLRFVQLAVAVAALFGGVTLVNAQIVANPTAAPNVRPTVGVAANGIPLIQIAQPNSTGLSHNEFSSFSVGSQGAILNNSRVVTGTQLAGQVQGNPNLSGGSANVILNEVVGGSRSQLNGYLEVAGQKAQVIISNENGITCSGCGWINTSRGVLTTGAPVFGGDGSLQAFRVTRGDIQINGLNAANTDQLDLISRSVAVNGQLWANQLNVITGTNQVNFADLGVQTIQGDNNKPTISIDVAALGGMYANKIRLVGTENGVGVRSLGGIASQAGDLNLDAQGQITLAGHTSATGSVTIHSHDGIVNSGTVYGQQAAQLSSDNQIANSGTVAAQGDLTLFAGSIASTGVLGAGIDTNSQATQSGNLNLVAAGGISATGQNLAGANIAMNGASLNLAHAQTNAVGNVALTARAGDIDHTGGNVQAAGATLNATGAVINDQGRINVSQLTSNSATLSNVGGNIAQSGTGNTGVTTTGVLNNSAGVITTNAQNLTIQSGSLNNASGQINHAGSGTAIIQSGTTTNAQGVIGTNGQLALTASSLNNQAGRLVSAGQANVHVSGDVGNAQGTIQSGGALTVAGANLDNTAGNITSLNADGLTLNASGQLTNANAGVIGGNGDVALTAASAINGGKITASHNVTTTIANSFDNSNGKLAAGNAVTASAASFKNANGIVDAASVALTVPQLDNSSGKITADQLNITSTNLTNEHGQIIQYGTSATHIGVVGTFDNSNGGLLQTNSADLSLTPQALNNSGGRIALAGSGTLTLNVANGAGSLSNAGGSIGSDGQAAVSAVSIANQGGSVFAQKQLDVTATQGGVDNSAGGYIGGSSLNLNAANGQINNTAGKIEGTQQAVTLNAQSLNNAGGTVQSVGAAPLNITTAQAISNTIANSVGGFIGGAGTVNLHAGSFDNSGGTVYSKDNLVLQSNSTLTNNYGVIQGAASVTTSATGALNNANGRIEANGSTATLTVSGSSIDNTAGRIANTGTGLTQINGGSQVTNQQGTLGGNGELDINATNLDNSQQGQVIAGGNLVLNTGGTVNNNAGSLYAAQNLQLNQSGAALTNVGGKVGAAANINVSVASINNIFGLIGSSSGAGSDIALATSGDLNNTAGTIASGRNLSLNAPTLIGNGKVIAGQDATINLQGDYANAVGNTLTANHNLTFTTTGNFTNTGTLTAANGLTLNAANVDNQSTGLFNASATTIQAANAITNTGRIYGDDIALGAQSLTNDVDVASGQAGAIAARNSINIGAATVVNREHAIIQSLGDMTFARTLDASRKAIGTADSITNSSATIDAGGNLVFQTAQLNNTNAHFATEQQVDPTLTTHVTEYATHAAPTVLYTPDQVTWSDSGDGGIVLVVPGNNRFEQFYKHDYTQTVSKTVVTSSDPGKISSGGGMVLSGNITNDKSTIIAGGTLSGTTGNINNIGATGTTDTVNHMTAGENYYHYVNGHPHQNHYDYDNGSPAAYDVTLPSTPLALAVWTVQQNTAPNSGANPALGQGVGATAVPTVGGLALGSNGGSQTVTGASGHGIAAAGGTAGSGAGVGGSNQTIGSAGNPLPNLVLPNNRLFTIQANPGQHFLVETDPAFTNYGTFLSSDYMLGLLGINPQTTEKRLGDGFYEAQVVTNQVAQLTGKRFLDGYASNEEEYKSLMEAGVATAKKFQLTPGIALTAEQMASLTSDIVWMVSQDVTLPDGSHTQVLAPVVYLTRADAGDISPTGALISGKDIDLTINGTLNNGGTLQASNNMIVQATDIANTGDIRSTGKDGTTILVAQNDILNNGGSISGHRVGVLAGRDVTMGTDAISATSTQGTNTVLGRVASVTADQLSVHAGRDINLVAAAVTTTGDATLSAGRDLNLTAVNTQRSYNVNYNADNHLYENQTQVNSTTINAGGNLALSAGQDINAAAVYATAGGQLAAVAGRNVNIGTAQQTSSLDQAVYTTSHGMFSSSSSRLQRNDSTTTAIGSTLSGDSVVVQAGHDIGVTGSNIIGTHDVTLTATNGNVAIVSAQDTSQTKSSQEEKKSGFTASFSGGVASVGYGKAGASSQSSVETVTQQGSTVASINGNTRIQAGKQLSVVASDISAGQNLTLIGKDVDLSAAQNTSVEHGAQQSSSSGISVGMTVNPVAAFKSAYQQSASGNKSTSFLGQSTKHADAMADGSMAASTPMVVQAGSRSASGNQDHANSTAQVSSLNAGNNLTILATGGSITSQGTSMSAGGDAVLIAKDNINLDVAHSYESQGQTNAAKGWSLDNRGSLPAGVFNSQGKGNGSTDTISGTSLSVGGKAMLATTDGDITLTASNLAANGDISVNAARNLTIQSGQDTFTNANQSNSQAIGKVVISDTERFAGYHSEKNQDNNTGITQVASNVGSLQGNVSLSAGDKYTQIASNILAKNDINIVGKSIDITTAANTGSSAQNSNDLKVGMFARISSPLIDLGNNIENAKKSDGRLQAMQGLAAASNVYQAASSVAGGSGELFKAEVGVGFASANSKDNSSYSQAQGSSILGGGNVSLTSTEGDIHATGAHIAAGDAAGKTLTLDSARNILLDAGQSTATSSGDNHSAGVEVGVGYEVGARTGVYAYVSANVGSGNYDKSATTNSNTHLSGDTVTLKSKGDTTLKGADVKANTINADVGGKLAIESVQDTISQHNEQSNVGGRLQISFGTAWDASGNLGQSTANGTSNAVNQQSGLFAGNGGYHVAADTVALKGGAIASSNAGNSDLTAKSITFENLTNKMDYSADTVSVSGGYGEKIGEASTATSQTSNQGNAPSQTGSGSSNPNITPGMALMEGGSASSTTYGTLTDGHITIGGQHMTSAAGVGAHTDLATAHTAIAPLPDLKNVMNNQQAMAAAANTVIATGAQIANDLGAAANKKNEQALAVLNNKDSTQEQKVQAQQDANDAQAAAKNWGPTGDYTRALKIVTGVLVGGVAGQGAGQLAANASAPYAAQAIGDYFAQPGHDNQTAQVLTHAVLGAILAAANGSSAVAGAGAGGAGELAAQVLTRELYSREVYPQAYDADGSFHPERLSASQTNTVIALSTAVGALVAGATGGSALDASVGGNIAANAATNNYLKHSEAATFKKKLDSCEAKSGGCSDDDRNALINEYRAISNKNNAALDLCAMHGDATCLSQIKADIAAPYEMPTSLVGQEATSFRGEQNRASDQVVKAQINLSDIQKGRSLVCGGLSTADCDTKVLQTHGDASMRAMGIVLSVIGGGVASSAEALGIVSGGVQTLINAGKLAGAELASLYRLGPVAYCAVNANTCIAAADITAQTGAGSAAPSPSVHLPSLATGSTAARTQTLATELNNFYRDGASPELIQQTFNLAAVSSTHNAGASEVVLGRYVAGSSDSYEAVAQGRGSTYFSMSDWTSVQGQLGADQMWNINKAFLDQQMALGKSFVFTANPALARIESYTYQEYDHLKNAGYQIQQTSGGFYRAVKK